jgi:hypothetical protein
MSSARRAAGISCSCVNCSARSFERAGMLVAQRAHLRARQHPSSPRCAPLAQTTRWPTIRTPRTARCAAPRDAPEIRHGQRWISSKAATAASVGEGEVRRRPPPARAQVERAACGPKRACLRPCGARARFRPLAPLSAAIPSRGRPGLPEKRAPSQPRTQRTRCARPGASARGPSGQRYGQRAHPLCQRASGLIMQRPSVSKAQFRRKHARLRASYALLQ